MAAFNLLAIKMAEQNRILSIRKSTIPELIVRSRQADDSAMEMESVKEQIKLNELKEKIEKNPILPVVEMDIRILNKKKTFQQLHLTFTKSKDKPKFIQKNKNHIKNLSNEEQVKLFEVFRGNFL